MTRQFQDPSFAQPVSGRSRGPAPPGLSIGLFGGFRLAGADGRPLSLASRKGRALLAYLALSPSGSASRESLATLLWSGSSDAQARTSLRQCLRQIRKPLEDAGFDGLAGSREEVVLDLARISVDLLDCDAALSGEGPLEALPETFLDPEGILAGFDDIDPGFSAWIRVRRRQWEDRYERHLRQAMAAAPPEQALAAAGHLVAIDPTHEEAHRCLIRYHAETGNVPAALRQYEGLWTLLAEDYDMEPDEQTQALIVDIKSGCLVPAPRPPAGAAPAPPPAEEAGPALPVPRAGTVLPRLPVIGLRAFVQGGAWQREDSLVEGFRRDLIAALVRFREWVVTEERAAFPAEPSGQRVDYTIEGSYYEEAGRMQLVLTLKNSRLNRYIWSERAELSLDGWREVRETVVRKLALSLNIYLSVDRMRSGAPGEDRADRIFSRWLAAQDLSYRWRPADEAEAEREFRSIIEEAPGFAPAYSSLVQVMNSRHHVFPGRRRSREQHREALDFARKAVEHDPLDCRTQLCLAWSYAMNARYAQAAMNYRLAYSLNENDPWTLVSCALGLAYCGELQEAAALEARARETGLDLSPLHWAYRAGVRFICGDYLGCVEAAEAAEDATLYIRGWQAAALANLGRVAEAREEAAHFAELVRDHWAAETAPSTGNIAAWFLDAFPIRNRDVVSALRDGLARAGLAAPG
ncbi:BTAD domain-containing putative transcriptional regulator [Poseidonocella sp. HB161398]|uniref:BTAD domain-containing putative transcriptional regulator n=1 Tax=Poseidonocella sp. HB161398 TaxID=2320855 RepID=UPI001108E849|nr:BTAD domain-containing putative transcriptional regulator [Poseidonocella sp. HB161398]